MQLPSRKLYGESQEGSADIAATHPLADKHMISTYGLGTENRGGSKS